MQVGVRMLIIIIIKHTGTYPEVGTCSSAEDTKRYKKIGYSSGTKRAHTAILHTYSTYLLHRNEKIDDHNDADAADNDWVP